MLLYSEYKNGKYSGTAPCPNGCTMLNELDKETLPGTDFRSAEVFPALLLVARNLSEHQVL